MISPAAEAFFISLINVTKELTLTRRLIFLSYRTYLLFRPRPDAHTDLAVRIYLSPLSRKVPHLKSFPFY